MKIGNITTDLTKTGLQENYERLYANKLDSLYEIDEFLETLTTKTDSRRNRKSEQTYNKRFNQ